MDPGSAEGDGGVSWREEVRFVQEEVESEEGAAAVAGDGDVGD